MDTDTLAGEIIFTFDGDAAGQKAALRAFEDDQRFVAQTFIAVGPDGMDPCELRLGKGDAAVRDLVARREPLIAFALRSVLAKHDLDTVEGQVAALRAAAPLVAKIKDRAMRPAYAQRLAGQLGMDLEPVNRAVASAAARLGTPSQAPAPRVEVAVDAPGALVEREALKLALQSPVLAGPLFDSISAEAYLNPVHATVREAIAEAGGVVSAVSGVVWIEKVREACADLMGKALVGELAVDPLLLAGEPDPHYVELTLARLQLPKVNTRVRELKSRLQRLNPVQNVDEHLRLFGELVSLEAQARGLRDKAAGAL